MLPMLKLSRATDAVTDSANSVKELADSANGTLSELSSQLRTGAQYGPYIIAGVGVIAVVALVVALVAVSRRG